MKMLVRCICPRKRKTEAWSSFLLYRKVNWDWIYIQLISENVQIFIGLNCTLICEEYIKGLLMEKKK